MLGLHNKMLVFRLSKQTEVEMMLGRTGALTSLPALFKMVFLILCSSTVFPQQTS